MTCMSPVFLPVALISSMLALKLPLGKTTVMHLVARETLPEPNSQGNQLSVPPSFLSEGFSHAEKFKCSAPSHFFFFFHFYTWLMFREEPLAQIIGSIKCIPKIQHIVQNAQLL